VKISTQLMYSGNPREAADQVRALEDAGLDTVWVPEAYGFDSPTLMGYLAAKTEKVEEVAIESDGAAANASIEVRIDLRSTTQRSIYQFAHPATIASIQLGRPPIERWVEHLTRPQVGADLSGGNTCVSNGAGMMHRDASPSTSASTAGRSAVLIRPWHTS